MSYNQVTDSQIRFGSDFKDNLFKAQVLKEMKLGDNLCICFKKDKWYYTIVDVALWSKCGNIKTVLFLRLKEKPKGKVTNFHGKDQFIFKYRKRLAIYSVSVYARNSYNKKIITDVGFTKIPNLKECLCN